MVAYIQVNFPSLRDWKSTRYANNREKILFMADLQRIRELLIFNGHFERLFRTTFIHHAGNNLFQSH
jgi:hypothetical protein